MAWAYSDVGGWESWDLGSWECRLRLFTAVSADSAACTDSADFRVVSDLGVFGLKDFLWSCLLFFLEFFFAFTQQRHQTHHAHPFTTPLRRNIHASAPARPRLSTAEPCRSSVHKFQKLQLFVCENCQLRIGF